MSGRGTDFLVGNEHCSKKSGIQKMKSLKLLNQINWDATRRGLAFSSKALLFFEGGVLPVLVEISGSGAFDFVLLEELPANFVNTISSAPVSIKSGEWQMTLLRSKEMYFALFSLCGNAEPKRNDKKNCWYVGAVS